MYLNNKRKVNSMLTIRVMCAIVFCLFSFLWLFWFQADTLAVAQHILSNGVTSYHRLVGAVVITIVLQMLQLLVFPLLGERRNSHALSYLPSMLVLAFLGDVHLDDDGNVFSLLSWCWKAPLVLVIWGGTVWLASLISPYGSEKEPSGLFSRRMWVNLLFMIAMMLMVAGMSNTNTVFHYRTHVEQMLIQGKVDDALRVGGRSLEADEHLTMLRAYALSLKGEMGEKLFQYPIKGSGSDLLPMDTCRSRTLLLPTDSIFRHLGALPKGPMTVATYYHLLEMDSLATSAVADYRLCGMLIDRRLEAFARTLYIYYPEGRPLPRHYREAMVLYTHTHSHPYMVYHDAVMDEDWNNLQELEKSCTNQTERKNMVFSRYRGSYWYYYLYEK